jgi:hypothetical protein
MTDLIDHFAKLDKQPAAITKALREMQADFQLSDLDVVNLTMLARYGKADLVVEALTRRQAQLEAVRQEKRNEGTHST